MICPLHPRVPTAPGAESHLLRSRGWGGPLSCPFLRLGSRRFRWGQTPALARSVPGRLAPSFRPRGQGPQQRWWHGPLPAAGHHPPASPQGGAPVGGKLPRATLPSHWLRIAAVPATRLPLPGWRSHIGSGGKRSSEFWAQLRLTEACQPHQKPDTPAPCPRPLPTCPPGQPGSTVTLAAAPLRLPGPVHPAPSPIRPVPPWPSPLGGPRPLHTATPALRGAPQEGGGSEEGGLGKGGASPSFSERAQSWSQKSRRRDIQTEPRRVWQEERERERGSGRRGGEREERQRERERERERERRGGPQFPNLSSQSL